MRIFILGNILLFVASACVQEPAQNGLGGYVDDETIYNEFMTADTSNTTTEMDVISEDSTNENLLHFTDGLINQLHDQDYQAFASAFHPTRKCAFTPYTLVDSSSIKLDSTKFVEYLNSNEKLHWGDYDGSGEPIQLTLKAYLNQFVYGVDFKSKTDTIHINSNLEFSNTLNNYHEYYPEAEFVEYVFKGTPEFEGMDWQSIIFYVEQVNKTYKLVAVAHNQWTI